MSETKKTLKKARAMIARPYGWCKGLADYQIEHPRTGQLVDQHCALGAIASAADQAAGSRHHVEMAAREALRDALPSPYRDVVTFNDDSKTTKKDVLALFDRAIEAVE